MKMIGSSGIGDRFRRMIGVVQADGDKLADIADTGTMRGLPSTLGRDAGSTPLRRSSEAGKRASLETSSSSPGEIAYVAIAVQQARFLLPHGAVTQELHVLSFSKGLEVTFK